MCQTKQGFLYSSVIQLLFHAPLLPFGRNLNLVSWGKNHRFFKFKESFPHTRPTTIFLTLRGDVYPTVILSQAPGSHWHLLENLRLHLVFQSLVHKESFCFPSSRFQGTHTGHHSAHMSPSSMPQRISVLDRAGNGPARREETEMQPQAHQLWHCARPLSPLLSLPAEAWWPSPKGDLDSLTPRPWYHLSLEREGQHRALFQGDWPCLWGLLLPISLPSLLR